MDEKRIRVLLVESQLADANLLQVLLATPSSFNQIHAAPQFDLERADRLATALTGVTACAPDVVLLNLSLPDSQGLDTLRQFKAQAPQVPIVVLIDSEDETLTSQIIRIGAHDYLAKGQFTRSGLVRTIRYAIEREHAAQALRQAHAELEERVEARTGELAQALAALQTELGERQRAENQLQDALEQLHQHHEEVLNTRQELQQLLKMQEQRVADRTHELKTLYDVMLITNSILDLPTLLTRCLELAIAAVQCWWGTIHLWPPDNPATPQLAASSGRPPEDVPLLLAVPEWQAVVQTVHDTGQPQSVPQLAQDQRLSYLGVPMFVSGQVAGVLSVYGGSTPTLTSEQVSLLMTLVEPISVAIERARLLHQTEQSAALEERQRMARELHDSVTQLIYSLYLRLETQRRSRGRTARSGSKPELEQLSAIAHQALKELRLILFELRPLELQHAGLVPALRQRLEAVERRAGLEAHIVVEANNAWLDQVLRQPLVEETLYRIAQEALNNALKHSAATAVDLTLSAEDQRLIFYVSDNGRGFDLAAVADRGGGQGLASMRERALKAGGQFIVHTAPGQGTRVCVELPGNPHA